MPYTSNNHRTQLQQNIRSKQQLAKRFTRRLNATTNPAERTFLRNEINNCVKELKQFARQWSANEYGSATWITTGFDSAARISNNRRNTTRSNTNSRSNNSRTRSTSRSRNSRSASAKSRYNRAFSFAF